MPIGAIPPENCRIFCAGLGACFTRREKAKRRGKIPRRLQSLTDERLS
jgi:hypothetical protein